VDLKDKWRNMTRKVPKPGAKAVKYASGSDSPAGDSDSSHDATNV